MVIFYYLKYIYFGFQIRRSTKYKGIKNLISENVNLLFLSYIKQIKVLLKWE